MEKLAVIVRKGEKWSFLSWYFKEPYFHFSTLVHGFFFLSFKWPLKMENFPDYSGY